MHNDKKSNYLLGALVLWVAVHSESADADTLCPASLILIPRTTTQSVTLAGISSEIAQVSFFVFVLTLFHSAHLPLQSCNLQE